jgi:hypothetical protein
MADITYYVAMPFTRDETGAPVAGAAEECQSSSTALRRAEVLSRAPGHIGAVAFSRSGDRRWRLPVRPPWPARRSC